MRHVHRVYADHLGPGPVEPDFGTAVRMHRLIDAVKRSAATGERQRLPTDG